MELLSETGSTRTYLGADRETWYEVKVQMRGQYVRVPKEQADSAYPEVIEAFYKQAEALLAAWFSTHDEYDFVEGSSVTRLERVDIPVYDWDDATQTTTHTVIGWLAQFAVERPFWPPMPEEPDPHLTEAPPRSRDIGRGSVPPDPGKKL
jgi:hypothetical protein